jgi:hypothetical protein
LKNTADAPIIAYGLSGKSKFDKTLNASGQTVWTIPFPMDFTGHAQMPRLEYLELKAGSLSSMLDFVARIQKDVEAALPEMQLKSATQRTGSGYEAQVEKQGIIDKIESIRETQFDATEDILQMALVADDVGGEVLPFGKGLEMLEDARAKYDLTIWADSVLPKSRAEESQIESVSLADGVITMRDARLQRGLSYSQVLEVEKQEEVEFNQMLERERKWLELHAEFGVSAPPMPKNAGNGNVIGNQSGNIRATKPTSAGTPGGNPANTSGNRTQGQPMTAPNGSAKNTR